MSFANDQTMLDNNDKKRGLQKKIKALEDSITLTLESNPPEDPTGLVSKMNFWEDLRKTSVSKLSSAISSQEAQIEQMREKQRRLETSILAIQNQLDMTRRDLLAKEEYYAVKMGSTQKKIDATQARACPKVRKIQLQKEALQSEIDELDAQNAYIMKMRETKTKQAKAEELIVPPSPSVSDSESDTSWSSAKIEKLKTKRKDNIAKGLQENKKTGKWEIPRAGHEYFPIEDWEKPVPKNEVVYPYGKPGPDGTGVVDIEDFDEEVEGIEWKTWCYRKDIIRARLGMGRT